VTKLPVNPKRIRYIKLGEGGHWEKECLEKGIIRMGFGTGSPDRFHLCKLRQWDELASSFVAEGKDKATATRFTNELRIFIEDAGETLWITFMRDRLQWGFVENTPAKPHHDGHGIWRTIQGGWCGQDITGDSLSKDRLSGALTKLAAYRGTSCDVDVAEYAVRRINGQKMPAVERALVASKEMRSSVPDLLQMLTPQDFELLVDLVFSSSGWRRLGVVGGTQDTLDIDLILPSTGERAFVQVKSKTTPEQLLAYVAKLTDSSDHYRRMFYVYHSGNPGISPDPRVTIVGPQKLADMLVDAGLMGWLIQKTS
jgi:hypothetical protein